MHSSLVISVSFFFFFCVLHVVHTLSLCAMRRGLKRWWHVQGAFSRIYNTAFSSFFSRTPRATADGDGGQSASGHGATPTAIGSNTSTEKETESAAAREGASRSDADSNSVSVHVDDAPQEAQAGATTNDEAAVPTGGASAPQGTPQLLDSSAGFMGILRKSMSVRATQHESASGTATYPGLPRTSQVLPFGAGAAAAGSRGMRAGEVSSPLDALIMSFRNMPCMQHCAARSKCQSAPLGFQAASDESSHPH